MKKFLSFESGIFRTENCYKLQKSVPEEKNATIISFMSCEISVICPANDRDKSTAIP